MVKPPVDENKENQYDISNIQLKSQSFAEEIKKNIKNSILSFSSQCDEVQ